MSSHSEHIQGSSCPCLNIALTQAGRDVQDSSEQEDSTRAVWPPRGSGKDLQSLGGLEHEVTMTDLKATKEQQAHRHRPPQYHDQVNKWESSLLPSMGQNQECSQN